MSQWYLSWYLIFRLVLFFSCGFFLTFTLRRFFFKLILYHMTTFLLWFSLRYFVWMLAPNTRNKVLGFKIHTLYLIHSIQSILSTEQWEALGSLHRRIGFGLFQSLINPKLVLFFPVIFEQASVLQISTLSNKEFWYWLLKKKNRI